MKEKEYLNLGLRLDGDLDPYECVVPMKELIPDSHEYLFGFLKADIGHIINDVETTLQKDLSASESILRELAGIHPYFSERHTALVCLIKTAFQYYEDKVSDEDADEDAEKKIRGAFIKLIDKAWDIMDIRSDEKVESLYDIRNWQKEFSYKVLMFLDDTNDDLASYPLPVRIALYESGSTKWDDTYIPDGHGMDFKVSKTYVLDHSSEAASVRAAFDFESRSAATLISDLWSLSDTGSVMSDKVKALADSFKNAPTPGYHVVYNIDRFSGLIDLEIWMMIQKGIRVRKCLSCGRYFVVLPLGYRHCQYPDEKRSSCLSRYLQKAYADEMKKSYIRVYHALYGKMKRGKVSQDQIDKWFELAKQEKAGFLDGQFPFNEYEKRLKNDASAV